jgi:hypothetical protein
MTVLTKPPGVKGNCVGACEPNPRPTARARALVDITEAHITRIASEAGMARHIVHLAEHAAARSQAAKWRRLRPGSVGIFVWAPYGASESQPIRLSGPRQFVGGGWGGIRTPGGREPTPVFKTGALNHSATHPASKIMYLANQLDGKNLKLVPSWHPTSGSRRFTVRRPFLYQHPASAQSRWRWRPLCRPFRIDVRRS